MWLIRLARRATPCRRCELDRLPLAARCLCSRCPGSGLVIHRSGYTKPDRPHADAPRPTRKRLGQPPRVPHRGESGTGRCVGWSAVEGRAGGGGVRALLRRFPELSAIARRLWWSNEVVCGCVRGDGDAVGVFERCIGGLVGAACAFGRAFLPLCEYGLWRLMRGAMPRWRGRRSGVGRSSRTAAAARRC